MQRRATRSGTVRTVVLTAVAAALAAAALWRLEASRTPPDTVVRTGDTGEHGEASGGASLAPSSPAVAIAAELPELDLLVSPPEPLGAAPGLIGSGSSGDKSAGSEEQRPGPSKSGSPYIWHDGDRPLQVWLEPDLGFQPGDDGISPSDIVERSVSSTVTPRDQAGDGGLQSGPVFRNESGQLMALPGGVLLVLDPTWDAAAVEGFFERNGISDTRATELDFVANGFFIETDPGFASLDLANELAAQDGVELSSPNWWTERAAR